MPKQPTDEQQKVLNKIPEEVQKQAVEAAKPCYSESISGKINHIIDNALLGGQTKSTSGPSEDGKLNTCASDMIHFSLHKAGVKLSTPTEKLIIPVLQDRAFEGRER